MPNETKPERRSHRCAGWRRATGAPLARLQPQHGRSGASGGRGPVEAVLPAGLPLEDLVDQILERNTAHIVIETPSRRDVADDEHSCSVPTPHQVLEEAADAGDRLAPALAPRERQVDVRGSIASVRFGRIAVAFAVVTLAQPPVEQDRRISRSESDVRGLHGTAKVGAEHGRDPVAPSSFTELAGLLASPVGQATVAPTRGDAELVVLADGVRLEHDGDGHRTTLRVSPDRALAGLAGSHRSDRAAVHGLDLHHVARVRGGDHLATADVETDVVTPARSPEHEVAGLHRA